MPSKATIAAGRLNFVNTATSSKIETNTVTADFENLSMVDEVNCDACQKMTGLHWQPWTDQKLKSPHFRGEQLQTLNGLCVKQRFGESLPAKIGNLEISSKNGLWSHPPHGHLHWITRILISTLASGGAQRLQCCTKLPSTILARTPWATVKTSRSLLQNAKQDPRSEAWFRLNQIYDPLIAGWVVRAGIEESNVSDITQEVLTVVSQELSNFEHNGRVGAFRSWLKLITVNRCRRYWDARKKQVRTDKSLNTDSGILLLNQLEDPNSDVSLLWDTEHDRYVFEKLVELIRAEFTPTVFDVFVRNTLHDETPQAIAAATGLSVNNIYKMKFRVMKRLREVAEGLLDDVTPDA